ncbi:coiled-coil domain-containing protein 177 [Cyclopterus lumpus]|uniref:coiled-coil domain-containing protein 177 n=1 Tax=Cyclopterus lumpus TaxID=8103 RepID=UPI0014862C91|nr:coiled-coil domain-containing protein 177 [Cyclopterus lumpus]
MGALRSMSRGPRLDLDNFDSADAQRSRYVLTSPRSLESCTRLGVKPVELLIKSLKEFVAERSGALPCEAMRVMHESYERERLKLLQMCRQERRRIIRAADRWPGANAAVSGLEVVSVNKLRDHTGDRETTDCITYADLCFKGKPASRSSCSHRDRSTVCTFSLGDLRHTPATERKLDRLTKDINKEMRVTVSERDRKIAALMLVKHQEEQTCLKLCQHEEQERQEARRHEEALRAQADKNRGKKLRQGMRRWHEELEARRRLRERREEERAGQFEQEALLQEDRWRRLREEVEGQRRERTEAMQKEAGGRKRYQEKLLREKVEVEQSEQERERRVAAEKEQRARRSKGSREKEERRRLQEGNRRELLRHILLKQQVEQQAEEEEARMRSTLEKKLQRSCERHTEAVEARLRELQERSVREEEQVRRARQRATLQSYQQYTHKQILGQLSQRRSERAAVHASAQQMARAQQTRRLNEHRQLCHQRLREEMQREEEAARKVREGCVFMKDWRRERLRWQREQIQEEAHRLARASFHMRDRVRQQTHRRTFDQMALEAQLTASMSRMKL